MMGRGRENLFRECKIMTRDTNVTTASTNSGTII